MCSKEVCALPGSTCKSSAAPIPRSGNGDKLHHAFFGHPLANAVDEVNKLRLNVGPMPKQGGSDTVNLSAFDPNNFRQYGGPSFRMVLDVGAWDNSRAVNAPGQSGDPASPHYRDLAPMWLKGEYFPLLYSRAKVEASLARRIDLVPALPSGPAASTAPTAPGR